MAGMTTLSIAQCVGALGALTPAEGNALAERIVDLAAETNLVTLDFTGVSAVTSSFANALFLTLADAKPLDEWRASLRFTHVSASAADVITRSLQAARAYTSSGDHDARSA